DTDDPVTSFAPDSIVLNRKLPLWYQVSQSLRASILGRSPQDPLRLPTEEQLAGHYGVSVLTMRQALKELEDEGLISRHRRRGTFIEPDVARGTPVRLLGSVDAIVAQQSGMTTELLEHGPAPVPADIAEHFPDLTEVAGYHRLRSDEKTGEPTNHARNWVRPELAARIDPEDLERWPMTKVLRDVAGADIGRITDTVEARLADPETARLLQVPLLSPILHYTGVTRGTDGRPLDVAVINYRGDRFSFTVTLDAHRSGPPPRSYDALRDARRRSAAGGPHAVVRRTAAARPGVAGGPRRGVPEGPLERAGGGGGARARGAVPADARPYAAHPGRAAAGRRRWHRAARPRLGAVPRAGAGAARPLRRAVADPRPPPDRRGPARAVAGGGRTADVRRGDARPRRRTGPAAARDPARAAAASRPDPAPVPQAPGRRTDPGPRPDGTPGGPTRRGGRRGGRAGLDPRRGAAGAERAGRSAHRRRRRVSDRAGDGPPDAVTDAPRRRAAQAAGRAPPLRPGPAACPAGDPGLRPRRGGPAPRRGLDRAGAARGVGLRDGRDPRPGAVVRPPHGRR